MNYTLTSFVNIYCAKSISSYFERLILVNILFYLGSNNFKIRVTLKHFGVKNGYIDILFECKKKL